MTARGRGGRRSKNSPRSEICGGGRSPAGAVGRGRTAARSPAAGRCRDGDGEAQTRAGAGERRAMMQGFLFFNR